MFKTKGLSLIVMLALCGIASADCGNQKLIWTDGSYTCSAFIHNPNPKVEQMIVVDTYSSKGKAVFVCENNNWKMDRGFCMDGNHGNPNISTPPMPVVKRPKNPNGNFEALPKKELKSSNPAQGENPKIRVYKKLKQEKNNLIDQNSNQNSDDATDLVNG